MVSNNSYIHIEFWMTQLGLSNPQIIIYAIIHGFSRDDNYYSGSQRYFRAWTGKSKSTVIEALNYLKSSGLIVVKKICINNQFYNIYYTTESRKPENEKLIHKIAEPKGWSENQTGPKSGPGWSEIRSGVVRNLDQVGPKSGPNNIAYMIVNNAVDSSEESAATAVISNKIIELFHSIKTFDKNFIFEIEQAILSSEMQNSQIVNYLDFAYQKTMDKKPSSIPGLFRKIVVAPDVIQDFLIRQPKLVKRELVICPVCGKQTAKNYISCECCGFELDDAGDEKKVQLAKAVNQLSDDRKQVLNNELNEQIMKNGLAVCRDPGLLKEQERRISLIYKKYGIDYQIA